MSRLWRVPERQFGRRVLKPALALASLVLIFLGAWLYDLSQSWEASSIVLLDARYERPHVVLRELGDPVRLTQQIAGAPEQAPALLSPELFKSLREMDVPVGIADGEGNQFLIVDSKIVKVTPEGQSLVVAENLDDPSSLAFDAEDNLLIVERRRGRILRVEAIAGEVKAGSPVSVFAEGFASLATEREDIATRRESRSERLSEEKLKEHVEPVYLTVSKTGEIFIGGQAASGEAVVYKIGRKGFKWWKFYCFYRC